MVNFIKILRANFTYESLIGSFFYLHVTREKLPKRHLYEKFAHKMLMKLTHKRLGTTDIIIIVVAEGGTAADEGEPELPDLWEGAVRC